MTRVLVTGCAGYVGSVLTRQLLSRGYIVRGMDALLFGGESLLGVCGNPRFEFARGDIRDTSDVSRALEDVTAVVHLAAIVGDPACARDPELAEHTNWLGAKSLLDLSADVSVVRRFVFASTCSNYGRMGADQIVQEESPLNPVSLYAKLKVRFEEYLLARETGSEFHPTSLRFATAYGASPRMRFDLTVNEFVREATLRKRLEIYGEQFWRPYCHVDDLATACVLILESNPSDVSREVFNVGDNKENYQKKMIAEELVKVASDARIEYVHKDEDPRDYRVDFSKIRERLGFRITKTVPDGIREVHQMLANGIPTDPYSSAYSNT